MMTTPLIVLASVLSTTPPTLPEQVDACWVNYAATMASIQDSVDSEMQYCLTLPDPLPCQANALSAYRTSSDSAWQSLINCINDAVLDHFGPNFMPQGLGVLFE